MINIGVDTVEIYRIERSMKKRHFLKFILGQEEYNFFEKKGFPVQSIAANFCCKEAFAKSINTGFRGFGLKNVQVLRDDVGRPYFLFSGNVLKMVMEQGYKFTVSITHTKNYATAVVLCYMEGNVR